MNDLTHYPARFCFSSLTADHGFAGKDTDDVSGQGDRARNNFQPLND